MAVTRIWDADNSQWEIVGGTLGTYPGEGYIYGGSLYYTADGSFTKANYPNLAAVVVKVQGGGAGGGAAATTAASEVSCGGGGGAGGYSEALIEVDSLAASETVTVGAGGAGGAAGANNGNNGNNSSFGTFATGNGGIAGGHATPRVRTNGSGGAGGSASNGDVNIGGGGGSGGFGDTDRAISGAGGSSPLGGGADSVTANADGKNAPLYGGGGGGAAIGQSQSARPGGDGADGIVIVDLYYDRVVTGQLNGPLTIASSAGQLLLKDPDTTAAGGNYDAWMGFYSSDDVRLAWVGTSTSDNQFHINADDADWILLEEAPVLAADHLGAGITEVSLASIFPDGIWGAGSAERLVFPQGSVGHMGSHRLGIHWNWERGATTNWDGLDVNSYLSAYSLTVGDDGVIIMGEDAYGETAEPNHLYRFEQAPASGDTRFSFLSTSSRSYRYEVDDNDFQTFKFYVVDSGGSPQQVYEAVDTAQLRFVDGSTSVPSIARISQPDTGIKFGSGQVGLVTDGFATLDVLDHYTTIRGPASGNSHLPYTSGEIFLTVEGGDDLIIRDYSSSTYRNIAHFSRARGLEIFGDDPYTTQQAWLTLDSPSTGGSYDDQVAGITIGESGYKGSAAMQIVYTGDGFGHIGMGTYTNGNNPGMAYPMFKMHYNGNRHQHVSDVEAPGWARFSNATPGSVRLDSGANYRVYQHTSSLRYKEDVQALTDKEAEDFIMALNPVTYMGKETQEYYAGLVAEELYDVEQGWGKAKFVALDEEGRPDNYGDEGITAMLIKMVQKLQTEVRQLQEA